MPGLAPLVERAAGGAVRVLSVGDDGRADVVAYDPPRGDDPLWSGGLVEDVFAVVGRARRADGDDPTSLADRLWDAAAVERALSTWAAHRGPLRRDMTFRAVVRVRQERSFRRTALRSRIQERVGRDRPRWRLADPAALEVWVLEHADGELLAGVRLTTAELRQGGGRAVERPGALRPVVARAMVSLAGEPGPAGVLLDPCCGSGSILRAAQDAGWEAAGLDIDAAAVDAARANVPEARVERGDARRLALADAAAGAAVSNLPFGRQYELDGGARAWHGSVLGELARVVRPGGSVVLLAPRIPAGVVPVALEQVERFRIRLLGVPTTIWHYRRRAA